MKNIDKCRIIMAEIEQLEAALLARFLVGKSVPDYVYSNRGNAGTQQWKVEMVQARHEVLWCPDRPKNCDVERLEKHRDKISALSEADPMKVTLHLSIMAERMTCGVPWQRLFDHSYGQYETKQLAEEANRKWHEDNDPRPDHFACSYCRKQTPNCQKVTRDIRVNYAWSTEIFCGDECAAHRQWGAEG